MRYCIILPITRFCTSAWYFLTVALIWKLLGFLASQRISVKSLVNNCYQITVRYGFKDEPNLPYALEMCEPYGLCSNRLKPPIFLVAISSYRVLVPEWRYGGNGFLQPWPAMPAMLQNIFKLPANRVLELGARVEI